VSVSRRDAASTQTGPSGNLSALQHTRGRIEVLSRVAGPAARILSPGPDATNGAKHATRRGTRATGFARGAGGAPGCVTPPACALPTNPERSRQSRSVCGSRTHMAASPMGHDANWIPAGNASRNPVCTRGNAPALVSVISAWPLSRAASWRSRRWSVVTPLIAVLVLRLSVGPQAIRPKHDDPHTNHCGARNRAPAPAGWR
jgi:hypothetical protein